jgi:uncharacterized membrane protein YedE/YeeE
MVPSGKYRKTSARREAPEAWLSYLAGDHIPGGLMQVEVIVMTIGGSIALIAIGAILRFAVTWTPKYVDLNAIGVILIIAGVVCLAISIWLLVSRRRTRASAQVYEQRRYVEEPPR